MPECEYCGKSRDKDHGILMKVQSHWSFPAKLMWMCKECLEKKGFNWEEVIKQSRS